MAKSFLAVVFISLLIVSGRNLREENVEASGEDIINCLSDALVVEGLFLKVCAQIATGILIQDAITGLKHIWTLREEFVSDCEKIFNPNSVFEGEFPDVEISYTEEGLVIDGNVYRPDKILEQFNFENCWEGIKATFERINEIGKEFQDKNYQKAVDLIYSMKNIADASLGCNY